MKGTKKLYDIITNIDDRFIEEAQTEELRKAPVWRTWAALAACLCIIVICTPASFAPWDSGGVPVPTPGSVMEHTATPTGAPLLTPVPTPTDDRTPSPAVSEEPPKTISIADLSQGSPGEFAGDMHRPEGYHQNIGSALALKMSITEDAAYRYSVLIRIPEGSTLAEALGRANQSLSAAIDAADTVPISIPGDWDTAERYYSLLTADQIFALAESGTPCYYVGSGQGDHKNVDWDTREGIDAFCELVGDMYVLAGDSIEAHPDIGIEDPE